MKREKPRKSARYYGEKKRKERERGRERESERERETNREKERRSKRRETLLSLIEEERPRERAAAECAYMQER